MGIRDWRLQPASQRLSKLASDSPEARSKEFSLRDNRERTGLEVPWLLTFSLEHSVSKAVLSHSASLFFIESLERKYTLDVV